MGLNEESVERAKAIDVSGDAHRRWHVSWYKPGEGWLSDEGTSRQGAIRHAQQLALDNRLTQIRLVEYVEDTIVLGVWNAPPPRPPVAQEAGAALPRPRELPPPSTPAAFLGGKIRGSHRRPPSA